MAFSLRNLFSAAKTGPQRVIGVDFGSSAVKVVELEHDGNKKPVLKTYGELQLGPYKGKPVGALVDLDFEQKKEALVDIMRESQVESRQGVFVMPLKSSFVTPMTIASGETADLGPQVRAEARKYIPVPLSDVTLDWVDITGSDVANKNLHELLLVAIQNEILTEQRKLMDAVSMSSQPTEIECFSLLRALDGMAADKGPVVVIDFGAYTSKLYIADENNNLSRLHRVRAGGNTVTERLAELHSLSYEEAELLKRSTAAQSPDADFEKTLVSVFDRALQEFKRVIDQYESRHDATVKQVYIAGATAKLQAVEALARDTLNRSIVVADPFSQVEYPAFMEDTLKNIGPNFAVALGAAFRSL